MLATCAAPFDTVDECQAACGDLPDLGTNSASINSGNTVQCRIWHVGAATVDADTHCGHAGGDAPCQ
jgi:hypothetical protein